MRPEHEELENALAAQGEPQTCATCRYQVAQDRNCQIVLMAAGVELRMMQKRPERVVPRPGDPRFGCSLHEAKP